MPKEDGVPKPATTSTSTATTSSSSPATSNQQVASSTADSLSSTKTTTKGATATTEQQPKASTTKAASAQQPTASQTQQHAFAALASAVQQQQQQQRMGAATLDFPDGLASSTMTPQQQQQLLQSAAAIQKAQLEAHHHLQAARRPYLYSVNLYEEPDEELFSLGMKQFKQAIQFFPLDQQAELIQDRRRFQNRRSKRKSAQTIKTREGSQSDSPAVPADESPPKKPKRGGLRRPNIPPKRHLSREVAVEAARSAIQRRRKFLTDYRDDDLSAQQAAALTMQDISGLRDSQQHTQGLLYGLGVTGAANPYSHAPALHGQGLPAGLTLQRLRQASPKQGAATHLLHQQRHHQNQHQQQHQQQQQQQQQQSASLAAMQFTSPFQYRQLVSMPPEGYPSSLQQQQQLIQALLAKDDGRLSDGSVDPALLTKVSTSSSSPIPAKQTPQHLLSSLSQASQLLSTSRHHNASDADDHQQQNLGSDSRGSLLPGSSSHDATAVSSSLATSSALLMPHQLAQLSPSARLMLAQNVGGNQPLQVQPSLLHTSLAGTGGFYVDPSLGGDMSTLIALQPHQQNTLLTAQLQALSQQQQHHQQQSGTGLSTSATTSATASTTSAQLPPSQPTASTKISSAAT